MLDVVLLVLIGPLGILAHELGHATVALVLTDGPVTVLVGQQPGIVRPRFGRLRFSLHFRPARGTGWLGLCHHDPAPHPRDRLLIIAAGPLASLLWAFACAVALAIWGRALDRWGVTALAIGAVNGAMMFVYNSAAAVMPSLMAARPSSDGARLQRALRARRALRLIETRLGRPVTASELDQMIATNRPPDELLTAHRSVPPPSGH